MSSNSDVPEADDKQHRYIEGRVQSRPGARGSRYSKRLAENRLIPSELVRAGCRSGGLFEEVDALSYSFWRNRLRHDISGVFNGSAQERVLIGGSFRDVGIRAEKIDPFATARVADYFTRKHVQLVNYPGGWPHLHVQRCVSFYVQVANKSLS